MNAISYFCYTANTNTYIISKLFTLRQFSSYSDKKIRHIVSVSN